MAIKAPRGVNDILPPESYKWQYIRQKAEQIFRRFNFAEIVTPIFEHTELFQRGVGEATDIVEKEMYTFLDKGGRSLSLRPEGTAAVMRAYLEHKIYGQPQPTKYFYFAPMFRYERPQAGRFRQHYQLGVEVIGVDSPIVDAEVIVLGLSLLNEFGIRDYELYLNSVGCPECRNTYRAALREFFQTNLGEMCPDCQKRFERNPMRILDCKRSECRVHMEGAPSIQDYLCTNCAEDFAKVCYYLDLVEIPYIIDPKLVRGLDYYTKTAFEIKYDQLGAQDTLCGGGRYNGLGEEIGDKPAPGIGFAIGVERLILTLEDQNVDWQIDQTTDLFLISIGDQASEAAFKQLHQLWMAGYRAQMDYMGRSVKAQMKTADRLNARYTIIIGDDELDRGVATLRDMTTGDQQEIRLDKLINEMQKRI